MKDSLIRCWNVDWLTRISMDRTCAVLYCKSTILYGVAQMCLQCVGRCLCVVVVSGLDERVYDESLCFSIFHSMNSVFLHTYFRKNFPLFLFGAPNNIGAFDVGKYIFSSINILIVNCWYL